jgi:hypothetical protein
MLNAMKMSLKNVKPVKRNCVFTGKQATAKLEIGDDTHNWARGVPCNKEFKDLRKGECLTENEMDAIALFYLIESHQLRVDNLKLELSKIQALINAKIPKLETQKINKNNEIESAYVQQEIQEEGKAAIEKVLANKLKIWD